MTTKLSFIPILPDVNILNHQLRSARAIIATLDIRTIPILPCFELLSSNHQCMLTFITNPPFMNKSMVQGFISSKWLDLNHIVIYNFWAEFFILAARTKGKMFTSVVALGFSASQLQAVYTTVPKTVWASVKFNKMVSKSCRLVEMIVWLESTPPSVSLNFCRSFNKLRVKFFSSLLDVNESLIRSHVFCSADLGGIGFTKSSILCKAAFLGGGENFVFEFFQRFPFDVHLINGESNFYLNQLQFELENLPSDIWIQCFPQNVQEIPTRSLPNLRFCLKKLQHHLVKLYEGLDYEVRLGLAKTKNPAFGNFLKHIRDSSAAALVTQVPSVYGLLLKNNEWLLNMRFRCFLWPNNLPNHLTCKCGKPLLFTHLLNCKHFITFRSKVHNNVRDQIYVMCKSYRVDSFLEPLLSKLILDDPNIDSTRYNRASMGLTRGDLVVPGLNGSLTILDAMSIDPCNSSNEHFINSDVNNPLLAGEKYKIAKYAKPISSVNENSHAQYNLCPFVFSLLGSLGKAAMAFLEDFVVVVKERTGRIFNRVYWQNRIVFSIFKGMVTLISDSLSSFGKFSESLAINCFDVGEAGFEDVEF
ncbi:hypothetical protein P9112_013512 [Eukaryota sp. TZLM1-RC]